MRDIAKEPRFEPHLDFAGALRLQVAIPEIAGREARHVHVVDHDRRWAEVLDSIEGSGMDAGLTPRRPQAQRIHAVGLREKWFLRDHPRRRDLRVEDVAELHPEGGVLVAPQRAVDEDAIIDADTLIDVLAERR